MGDRRPSRYPDGPDSRPRSGRRRPRPEHGPPDGRRGLRDMPVVGQHSQRPQLREHCHSDPRYDDPPECVGDECMRRQGRCEFRNLGPRQEMTRLWPTELDVRSSEDPHPDRPSHTFAQMADNNMYSVAPGDMMSVQPLPDQSDRIQGSPLSGPDGSPFQCTPLADAQRELVGYRTDDHGTTYAIFRKRMPPPTTKRAFTAEDLSQTNPRLIQLQGGQDYNSPQMYMRRREQRADAPVRDPTPEELQAMLMEEQTYRTAGDLYMTRPDIQISRTQAGQFGELRDAGHNFRYEPYVEPTERSTYGNTWYEGHAHAEDYWGGGEMSRALERTGHYWHGRETEFHAPWRNSSDGAWTDTVARAPHDTRPLDPTQRALLPGVMPYAGRPGEAEFVAHKSPDQTYDWRGHVAPETMGQHAYGRAGEHDFAAHKSPDQHYDWRGHVAPESPGQHAYGRTDMSDRAAAGNWAPLPGEGPRTVAGMQAQMLPSAMHMVDLHARGPAVEFEEARRLAGMSQTPMDRHQQIDLSHVHIHGMDPNFAETRTTMGLAANPLTGHLASDHAGWIADQRGPQLTSERPLAERQSYEATVHQRSSMDLGPGAPGQDLQFVDPRTIRGMTEQHFLSYGSATNMQDYGVVGADRNIVHERPDPMSDSFAPAHRGHAFNAGQMPEWEAHQRVQMSPLDPTARADYETQWRAAPNELMHHAGVGMNYNYVQAPETQASLLGPIDRTNYTVAHADDAGARSYALDGAYYHTNPNEASGNTQTSHLIDQNYTRVHQGIDSAEGHAFDMQNLAKTLAVAAEERGQHASPRGKQHELYTIHVDKEMHHKCPPQVIPTPRSNSNGLRW